MTGKLYICATPIGNLEDASYRLIRILQEVDVIVCEDTRHTLKLLNHYGIKKPLTSYHDYSSEKKEAYILEQVAAGTRMALVTDAGMPGISDPGQKLVDKAYAAGLAVEIIPGPSAVTAALIASGFPGYAFIFMGFLSRKPGKRRAEISSLLHEEKPVVLYEAPHRLQAMLRDIETFLGPERSVAVVRELTKVNEEIIRAPCAEVIRHFEQQAPRGEICIVIAGNPEKPEASLEQILAEVQALLDQGMDKKRAFKIKAQEYKIAKSVIYNGFINYQKSRTMYRPDG